MSELQDLIISDPLVQRAYDQGYDRGYRAGLTEKPKTTTRDRLIQRSDELFDEADQLWRAGDLDPNGRAARLERMAIDLVRQAKDVASQGRDE